MQGLEYGEPLYTVLKVTAEKIKAQICETGKKNKIANIEDMFNYRLYYYPFYVICAKGELKRRFFNDLHKQIFISVDAVEGYYAVAQIMPSKDYFDPDISDKLESGATILQPQIGIEEAWEKGVSSLRRSNSFSFRTSFWLNNKVNIVPHESVLIYKPYWKVDIKNNKGEFIRVIDATSGEVGGNNGYRFLQGYNRIMNRGGLENV
ncbi:MAG: hypothetical protein PHT78_02715 [Desulfitobacteriaceae bacterium]|nr:hypothetical protein [Desulfitobacteriaceae bacterium]